MRRLQAAVVNVILAVAIQAPLGAVDFVVTRYDDPVPNGCAAGDCSLREAVIAANGDLAADRILLSAGTYELTRAGTDDAGISGDLDVFTDLEVVGVAANLTTIDGKGIDRVIDAFDAAEDGDVPDLVLRGLRITGGEAVSAAGVAASDANLEIVGCEIVDNGDSGFDQHGVGAAGVSFLLITDSTIAGNFGDGVRVILGALAILENTTLDGNAGAGLRVIDNGTGALCRHCTLRQAGLNAVAEQDGGILWENSILDGSCLRVTGGTMTSNGGNTEAPFDTCGLDHATDRTEEASAGLLALALDGGTTRTRGLDDDSPALGQGVAPCFKFDQRGAARVAFATACDAGAVERDGEPAPTPIFLDGFEQGDPEAWSATGGA